MQGGSGRKPKCSFPAWWTALNQQITDCRKCPRLTSHCQEIAVQKRAAYGDQTYWGRPVPNFGDPCGRLLVVGLAPGAHGANRTGRMFTGDRSGDWLYRALHRAGFASQPESVSVNDGQKLKDCLITNACHCAPPGNKPKGSEVAECLNWLQQLLEHVPVKVVVALGGLAWDTCWRQWQSRNNTPSNGRSPNADGQPLAAKPVRKPRFGHGAEARLSPSVMMLGSYHPSQQNTFTGRLTEPMLDQVFQRAMELIAAPSCDLL